jgi:serine/threonine protein kinase
MGEVYRARDTRLGRTVAIKILPTRLSADPEAKQRFDREARAISSLNHPNICTLYDVGHQDGTDYLVMEALEGETLGERLRRGPPPVEHVLAIATEICEALEYAHERGIVHRDLKPANVKITPEGAVKLLDFGLATALEGEVASADIASSPTLTRMATRDGIILGTAAYMSPE